LAPEQHRAVRAAVVERAHQAVVGLELARALRERIDRCVPGVVLDRVCAEGAERSLKLDAL
jgi:hypothetical protein